MVDLFSLVKTGKLVCHLELRTGKLVAMQMTLHTALDVAILVRIHIIGCGSFDIIVGI